VKQITFRQGITNQMTTTRTFDDLDRLLWVSSVPSTASAVAAAYVYNNASQRTTVAWVEGFEK
jgi:hypothetical protein